MFGGTVLFYIVIYVISSLVAVESQRMLILNPLTRPLTPVRIYQYPQTVRKYCHLYSACLKCCKEWNNPMFASSSTPYKVIPVWASTAVMNHKEQVWNTRATNNHPMLRVDKNSLSLHKEHTDYQKHSSLTTSDDSDESTHLPLNNLSPTETITLNSSIKTSDSIITYQRKSSVNIKTSSEKPGFLFNNTFISGRRTNNGGGIVLTNITESLQNTDNMRNKVAPLEESTTLSVPNLTTYHYAFKHIYNGSSHDTSDTGQETNKTNRDILFGKFIKTLDKVERKFLLSSFKKLSAISPENRKENGISFLQSGLFLYQLLISLSITMDQNVTREIEEYLGLQMSEADKIEILNRTVAWLPKSNDDLKFRWSSRLVVQRAAAAGAFRSAVARALPLRLSWLDGNETSAQLTEVLNSMVLSDSGDSMHDTFSEQEVEGGVCAAALGTAYVRGTWRAAPTLLNDSLPFRDAPAAPQRSSRYFRLNDLMAYAYLHEWDAEAIEIPYATAGLTLLILVPKEPSLRPLVERVAAEGLGAVVAVMNTMRVAVTLPLYTLRMTLLLPNKLEDMGMPSLLTNASDCQPMRLSHAVQRLMFWAEAGRHAFKDDGIEWDPRPELEIVVDRPYLFFVRWGNITIMNGVFAL